MGICYIVGAGSFKSKFVPGDDDFVIAADGGYDSLIKNEIKCDLLIGDLDSIENIPTDIEILRHPVKKTKRICFWLTPRVHAADPAIFPFTEAQAAARITRLQTILCF